MTILEAINKFNREYPNQYPQSEKIRDLSDLDKQIYQNIMNPHSRRKPPFEPYDSDTPVTKELLLPESEGTVYILWLKTKYDFYNREYTEYNNSLSVFNSALDLLERSYAREHSSVGVSKLMF